MSRQTAKEETSPVSALNDPVVAAAYVNAALEDEVEDEEELFLIALRSIAKAHGMAKLASATALKRENLYRMLSADGNPRLSSLCTLLRALGLRLAVGIREGHHGHKSRRPPSQTHRRTGDRTALSVR